MAATALDIANVALARIGEKQFIDDAADGSTAADIFARVYEHTRDTLLERVPWNFAKKQAGPLAALADVERDGWGYCFTLPADCLAIRRIATGFRQVPRESMVPFEIQAADDLDGLLLCCDEETPTVIYTAKVETVPLFSAPFCDALAWGLAKEFAYAIPGKLQMMGTLETKYELAIKVASAASLREAQPDAPLEGSAVRARR